MNALITTKNSHRVVLSSSLKNEKVKGYSFIQYGLKRIFDIIMILLLFIVSLPIGLYTIYRIKKESKGSIFFKQNRVGLNGKIFTCYKFRSMHTNSHFNPYTEDNDSRIFSYGNIMRKYRIDELPQIFNVLKGDMHLIGPRAEWDILVDNYSKKINGYEKRHLVKPGITGLAQVSYPYGRNINDAIEKLKYDLFYIKNWSPWLELKVDFKTVLVILGKEGV